MMAARTGARALAPWAPRPLRSIPVRALVTAAFAVSLLAPRPVFAAWQTFGLADGLASLRVRAIAQDSSETLWFTTSSGVSRYDGATFRNYGVADGLASNDVGPVLADRSSRLWFGTGAGVSRLDHGIWTTFTAADGLASNDVRDIIQDRDGNFWFASSGFGASRFDGITWTTYDTNDGLVANQLNRLYEDRTGNLWFGTNGSGISRYDGAQWTSFTNANTAGGLADNTIECILQTRDDAIWIGTRYGGLCRFDGSAWTNFLPAADVTGLREDREGRLWVATKAALARFDGRIWRWYGTADGVASTSLSAILIDGAGNRWVGSDDRGASRYDGESWTKYTDAGLDFSGPQALFEDTGGDLWVGTAFGGIARYDRSSWESITVASTSGGLASDNISAITQDRNGALWFGTTAGVSRRNGTAWSTFTTADGLVGNNVAALARDSSGSVWFGTTAGLSRFNGVSWTSFTSASGLPANRVRSLRVDHTGRVWCGTSGGVAVYSAGAWTSYTTADGLAGSNVYTIHEDHSGALWFGTTTGLSRFDGVSWRTYTTADGLASDQVRAMTESPDSVLWIGTATDGVSRFDGTLWRTYTDLEGLPANPVSAVLTERGGYLWFATDAGITLYEPARVPPQTVITSPAPLLSANTLQTVQFAAAYRQVVGIEFATSLDGGTWSPWTPDVAWVGRDLTDGVHTLRVAARDRLHHVDPTPAACTFEIAATPPVPIITSPVFQEPVRDTLVVTGRAQALRFRSWRIEMRPAGEPTWDPPHTLVLAQSNTPVASGRLASFSTRSLPDGDYELRLAVLNTLGLTGYTVVAFIVDNVAPFAAQTTPALVSALSGGEVFTTNREAHVTIPPRALPRDATVRLDALDPNGVPDVLPDGATRIAAGYLVDTEGVPIEKTAVLDLAVPTGGAPAGKRLAVYRQGTGGAWQRLGGTLDPNGARLSTPISSAGSYAVYAAPRNAEITAPLQLSLTPRVFSSRGSLASPTIQIGFVLAREATVRVTIHNRAGRLVRIVTSGQSLGPGTNVVSWDGRDEDHRDVESGLYLVSVEALGESTTKTLAVVR